MLISGRPSNHWQAYHEKLKDYLKEICRLSEINKNISNTITKRGVGVNESNHKWEKISTHSARRSFATNMHQVDLPGLTILAVTGHRTERSFLRYIKINQEKHALKLLKIWKNQDSSYLKAV